MTTASQMVTASPCFTDEFCYLCGEAQFDSNRDHVPPRRIFPSELRANVVGSLLTLKTHPACQKSFQRDEEYFFTTLLPNALRSRAGVHLGKDFRSLIQRDSPSAKLAETVRRQFEDRPSGLVLPDGRVIQRIDGARLYNVVWKIARGLFSHRAQRFLPANTTRHISMHAPFDGPTPTHMASILRRAGEGHTPECFAYAFSSTTEEVEDWDLGFAHILLMNFWESYLFYVMFHDPDCACGKCSGPDLT